MPKQVHISETRKAIEGSSILQDKLTGNQPPSDFPEKEEPVKIIQTDDDKKKAVTKKVIVDDNEESGEQKNQREESERQQESKERKVTQSFRRENPFEKKRREAEEATSQAGEYKTKYETSEAERIRIEGELAEARQKLEDAGSDKDRKTAQQEVQAAKDELARVTEDSKKERDALMSRIEFHDLRESPRFQQEFVAPVVSLYQQIDKAIGSESENKQLLASALNANGSALATEGDEQTYYESIRDQAFTQLAEKLPGFTARRLEALIGDFLVKTERQAEALKNWEPTRQRIMHEAQQQQREAQVGQKKFWDGLYKETGEEVDSQVPVNEELEKILKDNSIEVDFESDAVIAKGCMTDAKIKERDVTRILNQGRAFSRATAYMKAQEIKIKGLEALVTKMRGSDPGNLGDRGGNNVDQQRTTPSLADKFSRHRPGSQS